MLRMEPPVQSPFPVLFSLSLSLFPAILPHISCKITCEFCPNGSYFFVPILFLKKRLFGTYTGTKNKLCNTAWFVPVFLQSLSQAETNFLSISSDSDGFDCPNFRQKTVPKEVVFPASFGTYNGTKKQGKFSCFSVPMAVIFLSQSHAVNPHGNKSLSLSQYR